MPHSGHAGRISRVCYTGERARGALVPGPLGVRYTDDEPVFGAQLMDDGRLVYNDVECKSPNDLMHRALGEPGLRPFHCGLARGELECPRLELRAPMGEM